MLLMFNLVMTFTVGLLYGFILYKLRVPGGFMVGKTLGTGAFGSVYRFYRPI